MRTRARYSVNVIQVAFLKTLRKQNALMFTAWATAPGEISESWCCAMKIRAFATKGDSAAAVFTLSSQRALHLGSQRTTC